VRVITKRALTEFAERYADSVPSLSNWFIVTRKAKWQNFAQVREDFGSADQVGRRTVFNIAGNRYRLVARVNYRMQRVYVLHIMKHEQYDKGEWK
jgi:mRNA interferase HigB